METDNHTEDRDNMERVFLAVRNLGRHYGVSDAFSWTGFEHERVESQVNIVNLAVINSLIGNQRVLTFEGKKS